MMAKTPAERQKQRRDKLKNDGYVWYRKPIRECWRDKLDATLEELKTKEDAGDR